MTEKPSKSARKKFSVNADIAVIQAVESLSLDKKCVSISRSWVVEQAAVGEYNCFFFFSDFKCLDQSGAAEALSPAQRGNDKD